MPNLSCDIAKKDTMTNLLALQGKLETMISEKPTTGMDNLLRSLADELEDKIGNMKSFLAYEAEEKK